jgi:hypothetical protein
MLHGGLLKFKLPFRCDIEEGHPPLTISFGFLMPKIASSYDSPPTRKPAHQQKDDFTIVNQVTVQE